jgi:tRNA(Ile)-lysidine synthase
LNLSREALLAVFRTALGPVDHPLGLAVSGGGDSVAMLCLAHEAGLPLRVVTVDHGLREGSAGEAAWVAELCATLGVRHDILRWTGWDRSGNLQDQARRARLSLMADWAQTEGIGQIALGHTRDDQAETVLMRLGRRAGADGLSAMAPRRGFLDVDWLRPLLTVGREDLRAYLRARGQDWIDDPSNEALRFDRVKVRRALAVLEPLGIGPMVLAEVAAQMAEVRAALDVQTAEAARVWARVDRGDVLIDRAGLSSWDRQTMAHAQVRCRVC